VLLRVFLRYLGEESPAPRSGLKQLQIMQLTQAFDAETHYTKAARQLCSRLLAEQKLRMNEFRDRRGVSLRAWSGRVL
jgi:hypothetical protein